MAKAKTRISKLRVNEVSLVDRPANPAARLVIAKRSDDIVDIDDLNDIEIPEGIDKMMCADCGEKPAMKGSELCADCAKLHKALEYNAFLDLSIETIMNDESVAPVEKRSMIEETISQYRDGVLALEKLDSPDATATNPVHGEQSMSENITKSEVEALLKGLSPEQTAAVEKLLTARDTVLKTEIEKAQKDAKDAREEIAKRDRIAKAQSMVKNTSIKPEDVVKVLEATNDNADVSAFVADTLAKLDTAIKAGRVLQELGDDHGEAVGKNVEIDKAIESVLKADPKLSKEQAFAKALLANPQLYDSK